MLDLGGTHLTGRQLIRRGTVALVVVGVVASVLLVKSAGLFDRSLHVVAEHERRKAERDADQPSQSGRLRPRFAELVALLALVAAIAAWWH